VRLLGIAAVVVACGGKPPPAVPHETGSGAALESAPPVHDMRTSLEKRRDAACDLVAQRVTACAVADAKRDLAGGKVTKEQFALDTQLDVLGKNTDKYAKDCKSHHDYSSRQIRVLEKCPQYESECEPFLRCLDNVQPQNQEH
jgi:hypothetical protein